MSEEMFLTSSGAWDGLKPHHILALRAVAPSGVFTDTAKGGYLSQVGRDSQLGEIADALFSDDYRFLTSLPAGYKNLKPQLLELMRLAYSRGVRVADSRVRNM